MYKKILVPFDGSAPSKNALKEAVELAKQSKGKIFLLYVIQEVTLPHYAKGLISKTMKEYEKEIYFEAKSQANKLFEKNIKNYSNSGIKFEKKTLYGNTAEKILGFIKNNKIDIVVIGTTSRTGISKIIALGSVARKVSEESKCPVLLIH